MLAPESFERFTSGRIAATPEVFHTLPDTLRGVGAGRYIEQPLIGFDILNDGLRFAIDSQNYGAFALFDLPHEFAGTPPECSEGLNVLGDIKHRFHSKCGAC